MNPPVWDIFCQVIDNWGDAGVCWRLAQQLSQRGIHARLWIDDPEPLGWMQTSPPFAPAIPVEIVKWRLPIAMHTPGQVLIEAFGCHAPDTFLAHAAKQPSPPVWINLEYLSAQNYAEYSHGLPSPQCAGPAQGLIRWFYYPGFTLKTGGLLRETDLSERQQHFNISEWLRQHQIPEIPHTQRVSLFCYDNQALPPLLEQWQQGPSPVHVLVTPGATAQAINRALPISRKVNSNTHPDTTAGRPYTHVFGQATFTWLPYLTQQDFDHLLWSCHLNFVRGEDSWVRAIWAGRPFIWQPYIQSDNEHLNKLEAFLALIPDAHPAWLSFERQWTLQNKPDWTALHNSLPEISPHFKQLKTTLQTQPDLVTQLMTFCIAKNKTH